MSVSIPSLVALIRCSGRTRNPVARVLSPSLLLALLIGLLTLAVEPLLQLNAADAPPVAPPPAPVPPPLPPPAPLAPAGGEWQKFKGKAEPYGPGPLTVIAAQVQPTKDRVVTFPAGNQPADLPLNATFADGRPLKAAVQSDHSLWIDSDGDGKIGTAERFNFTRGAHSGYGPITLSLKYSGESTAPYSFYLTAAPATPAPAVPAAPVGNHAAPAAPIEFHLTTHQQIRYTIAFNRHTLTIVLIDLNNDGRYDSLGEDLVLVDNRPPALLAKTVTLGSEEGTVIELLVYPDGTTLELRPFTGDTGVLDPVSGYTPAAPTAQLQYLVADGADAHPGFSPAFPRARVPVGDYHFGGAWIAGGAETVRVEAGDLPAVTVAKTAPVQLPWGGPTRLKYGFHADGETLVFDGFRIIGAEHGEIYRPTDLTQVPFRYQIDALPIATAPATPVAPAAPGFQGFRAGAGGIVNTASSESLATGAFEPEPAGGWKPLRMSPGDKRALITFGATYPSKAVGNLVTQDPFEFLPTAKPAGGGAGGTPPNQEAPHPQAAQAPQPGQAPQRP